MNEILKKILGLFMILLSPTMILFMIWQADDKISKAAEGIAKLNITVQWSIILFIFIPVCFGLALTGYYALKGEYDYAVMSKQYGIKPRRGRAKISLPENKP